MKIGIIGAGLTGLVLGNLLEEAGIAYEILEARNRIGGRIHTVYDQKRTPVELGATWYGQKHMKLVKILDKLGLASFEQYQDGKAVFEATSMAPVQIFDLPKGQPASLRIGGGSSALIEKLSHNISENKIELNVEVKNVTQSNSTITISDQKKRAFAYDYVVSTLPPYLLQKSINFSPGLPSEFMELAKNTQTWMGTSIKFAVTYEKPFWREKGFAGIGFSNSSIASEIHDHTDIKAEKFALKGFLVSHAAKLTAVERENKVREQLIRFFGEEAKNYLSYVESIWANEYFTMGDGDNDLLPHYNQGHLMYQSPLMDGKLFISGTETSPWFGGYMEGAIHAADLVYKQILKLV